MIGLIALCFAGEEKQILKLIKEARTKRELKQEASFHADRPRKASLAQRKKMEDMMSSKQSKPVTDKKSKVIL